MGGGSSLGAFLGALMIGRLAYLIPTSFGDKVSLRQCEIALDNNIDEADIFFKDVEPVSAATLSTRFAGFIRRYLAGRAFFQTAEGWFGVCPYDTKVGDEIVVLLGCEAPLVIKESEAGKRSRYQVVRECYVPGVMSGESLLGKLPDGWTTSTAGLFRHGRTVYTHGDVVTQKDPIIRLPAACTVDRGRE